MRVPIAQKLSCDDFALVTHCGVWRWLVPLRAQEFRDGQRAVRTTHAWLILWLGPGSTCIRPHRCEALPSASQSLSFGRLQAWGIDPDLGARRGVGLPRLAKQFVLLCASRQRCCLFPCILGERREPIFERCCLLETTPSYHGALLSLRGRRERNRRSHHRWKPRIGL